MLLSRIAAELGLAFEGEDIAISGMNTLRDAGPSELSFIMHRKHASALAQTNAGASRLFAPPFIENDAPVPVIGEASFVDSRAHLENGVVIGKRCTVMAGVYLGSGVRIGDDSVLFPNTTVYRDTVIGSRCRIHGGTTIGADGFGYAHTAQGEHVKIYQNGNVVIGDDVEIGSNSSIDRAVFASTHIRKGSKLDNNVHIGHNCDIGEHCIIVAQVGIGGSTSLGRNCVVSGQTAFTDHLEIAPFTTFTARSGVTKSIKESGKVYSGYPLMEHRLWSRLQSRLAQLAKEGINKKRRAKANETE